MTTFDRVIARTRAWLEAIDRERDLTARQLASDLRRKRDDRAALEARFIKLDVERADVVALLGSLEQLATHPVMLLETRPTRVLPPLPVHMAKATLPARHYERRSKPRQRKVAG